MEKNGTIEGQMKQIARRTKIITRAKWFALVCAPFEVVLAVILGSRPQQTPFHDLLVGLLLFEAMALLFAGFVLHFIKALFEAVAVVLDELRTTI
jgi:hypothetical protein